MPRQTFVGTVAQAALGFVVVMVVWEFGTGPSAEPTVIPPPSVLLRTAGDLLATPEFRLHVQTTLAAVVWGVLPAAVIAVPFGLGLRMHPGMRRVLTPFALVLGATVIVALGPLFAFRYGPESDAATAMAFWMSAAGVVTAMTMVRPPATADPAANRLTGGEVREAVSASAAGLRLGVLFGVSGVTVLEMTASNAGIGFVIADAHATFAIDRGMAAFLVLAVPTAIVVVLLQALELELAP